MIHESFILHNLTVKSNPIVYISPPITVVAAPTLLASKRQLLIKFPIEFAGCPVVMDVTGGGDVVLSMVIVYKESNVTKRRILHGNYTV